MGWLTYFEAKQIVVFPYFINRASQFKTKVPAVILSRCDDSIQPHVVYTGPFQKDSLQTFVQENKLPRLVSIYLKLTLCMLGNFSCFCCRLLTFQIFSKNYFRNKQFVKCLGSRSGPTFCLLSVLTWGTVKPVLRGHSKIDKTKA